MRERRVEARHGEEKESEDTIEKEIVREKERERESSVCACLRRARFSAQQGMSHPGGVSKSWTGGVCHGGREAAVAGVVRELSLPAGSSPSFFDHDGTVA